MTGVRGLLICALFLLVAGCSRSRYPEGRDETVRQRLPKKFLLDLEQADRLQLVAIDELGATPDRLVRPYSIRGAVDITSPAARERVIRTFYRAVRDGGGYFLCWNPHHAIRAWRQGVLTEIVMCMSCAHLYVPDGEGGERMVVFKPEELTDLFTPFLEPRGLRFDPTKGHFGGWVEKK